MEGCFPATQPAESPPRADDAYPCTQAPEEGGVPPPPPRVAFVLVPDAGSLTLPIELVAGSTALLGSRYPPADVVLFDEKLKAANKGQYISARHATVSVGVEDGLDTMYITAHSNSSGTHTNGVWLGGERLEGDVATRVRTGARVHFGTRAVNGQPYELFVYTLHEVNVQDRGLPDAPLRAERGRAADATTGGVTSKSARKRARKQEEKRELTREIKELKAAQKQHDNTARLHKRHRRNESFVRATPRRVDVDFVPTAICRDYNNQGCSRGEDCRFRHEYTGGRRRDHDYHSRRAGNRGMRRNG